MAALDPTSTSAWNSLDDLAHKVGDTSLRDLFAEDTQRAEKLTVSAGDLTVDFSKNRVTDAVLDALIKLAEETGVQKKIDAMFAGEHINNTEDRAVGHVALRMANEQSFVVDGENMVPAIHAVMERARAFAEQVRSGTWKGHTGKAITDVVNIGIGGSDLGPAMAYRALAPFHDGPRVHFVSNVDGADLGRVVANLNAEQTLFIVASKSFTTIETLTNAESAREWLLRELQADTSAVAKHFVALSTNAQAVGEFGIDTENMFGFWDWVGGRYSVPSVIGLSVMLGVGPTHFTAFLDGFAKIDDHLRIAPARDNAPLLMALIGVWYRNFLDFPAVAVLPYNNDLARFPAYLQQLDMESNGKRVRTDGVPVTYETGPIVFGEPGTNGQHAFYQLIHQGTTTIPCEFIGFFNAIDTLAEERAWVHNDQLFANMIAQAEALAFGETADEVRATGVEEALVEARTFPGNTPSTLIVADALTPSVLGQLIALYEHKVLIQGAIWQINSFDQWGVQLGKVLAKVIEPELAGGETGTHDASTTAMIAAYRAKRG
ncbi:glucose-6-phosphate isomerase [Stomatohabitans albus]|uniref:glucose-6-phosphate isomerase n=1 Tax=Stomatohabitans albus TaxID=3110766 RepID=UPI00300C81FB